MNITPLAIESVYTDLINAEDALCQAHQAYAQAKNALTWGEYEMLATGAIQGKNQAERDANLARHLRDNHIVLTEAERQLNETKLLHKLAQLRVDQVRLTVRLLEIERPLYAHPTQ